MSYAEKLLLQKNRRDVLRPNVRSESEFECGNSDLLVGAAKETASDWKTQEEPDMEMLYLLSQISGEHIRSSCAFDLNCPTLAKPLCGANEYVNILKLLSKTCI
ncbi:hypothetical protein TSMEX_010792 [Taenia solium]|eukprot:TsM_000229000 transcript=TsM_000229000 gene=TsM_000229000